MKTLIRPVFLSTILGAAVILFAHQFPRVDLYVSSLFYTKEAGFWLRDNLFVLLIYKGVPVLCALIVLASFVYALMIWGKREKNASLFNQIRKCFIDGPYRKVLYFLLVCAIGPGLLVHNVLKDCVERPRPRDIVEFGGYEEFNVPSFSYHKLTQNSDERKHHSFPSGHASVGYMFMAIAMLYKGAKRYITFVASTILGLVIGIVRVAQGEHFLTDILFSFVVVYFTSSMLYSLLKMQKFLDKAEHAPF